MKKLGKILMVFVAVLVLSGCVKQTVHMEIGKDGKIKTTIVQAISKEYESYMGEDSVGDSEAMEKAGFKVSKYDDDKYVGNQYEKTINIKDVSSDKELDRIDVQNFGTETYGSDAIFTKDGDTYKAKFVFDASDDSGMAGNMSDAEISFSVTLPSKAKSHNADSVEGKTYTWNVPYGETKEIDFEFTLDGSFNWMLVVGIVAGIAVVAGVVIFLSKKKGSTPTAVEYQQPVAPVEPEVTSTNDQQ